MTDTPTDLPTRRITYVVIDAFGNNMHSFTVVTSGSETQAWMTGDWTLSLPINRNQAFPCQIRVRVE